MSIPWRSFWLVVTDLTAPATNGVVQRDRRRFDGLAGRNRLGGTLAAVMRNNHFG